MVLTSPWPQEAPWADQSHDQNAGPGHPQEQYRAEKPKNSFSISDPPALSTRLVEGERKDLEENESEEKRGILK